MNRALLLRTIARRFARFRGRSLALGLGIAAGTLATVLLMSAAGRIRARFLAFIGDAYPSDALVLFAGGGPMSPGGKRNLKLDDVEAVVASLGVRTWDPLVFAGPRDLRRGGASLPVGVMGLSEQAETVRHRPARDGRWFTAEEVRGRARVALLGTTTAARLFPGEAPAGARIEVDGVPFEIVGVLASIGVDPHGGDQDNVIVVPYTTLMDSMLRTTALSGATLVVDDRGRIEAAAREAGELLRRRHGLAEGDRDDFSVFTSAAMQAMFRRNFRTFELFVPLIAGTLFLVAGLVVLAVLQAAVRARRHEIGLRRAVGARARDVTAQILAEAALVALAAAAGGVGLARLALIWVAPLLERKMGVTALALSPVAIAVGVAAALATGLVGAWLPARRAARLDPVAALR